MCCILGWNLLYISYLSTKCQLANSYTCADLARKLKKSALINFPAIISSNLFMLLYKIVLYSKFRQTKSSLY